ncbi:hypothetical protein C8N30_3424 [Sulfitobacter guttiformis]|uniref:Uncharacterized protein n=2 Tax=Sulfitobacter guttiformis TaxID=74349 RepID=A0A420DJA8_9RHOB|nr:hypothetical protein C8N30_3424 [Sulfitobacter guttiformis]
MIKKPEKSRVGGGGAATSSGIFFQQRLGSVIGAWMLSDQSFDRVFNLGDARPSWMRFETEAPVDDILVATDAGGFVAIQAKTSASLSAELKSPFGKTISQFVKHWLVCRDGDGQQEWNRPLSVELDRLVLAVGPESPASIREDLPRALRLKSQPGGGELTVAQQRAFDIFSTCVENAWLAATVEPFDTALPSHLASLIVIFVFNPEEAGQQAIVQNLRQIVVAETEAEIVLTTLESLSAEMMSQRGGADSSKLRQALISRGVALSVPPNYADDIAKLRAHSEATAEALSRYEVIEAAEGNSVSLVRECQPQIEAAAREGSLLIIGEPGSGKSGVLNSLARTLRDEGNDVLELAVDRFSVETLEGLGRELEIKHALLDVIGSWDGEKPAWLVIDALDATRGGVGEGVFRNLIEQVLQRNGRWRVVASIRTFDLRMGQKFRSLFAGEPPIEDLMEHGFSNVRHVRVPEWSDTEFQRLLDAAPALDAALQNAPRTLRDIASVPFNTRLLSDLVKDGLVATDLSHVSSQAQLLQLYWSNRIESHGNRARSCISRIAKAMVSARALRAPVEDAEGADPEIIDTLTSEGVIISVENGRWIQFRHHLLFDFAAARVLIDPAALVDGSLRFPKDQAQGLMLAPALSFVLREIWESDESRSRFWSAAAKILADNEADPVIRGATGRICAEYPEKLADTAVLAMRIVADDTNAAQAFSHTCGAFAVRLEDYPNAPTAPWTGLLRDISENLEPVAGTVRFLLFNLVKLDLDQNGQDRLGISARALLRHALTLDVPHNLATSAIDLVAATFITDPVESHRLLLRLFEPQRLQAHGWEEVPALCRKIEKIAPADPDLAIVVYRETFGFAVTEERETRMGDSQIMPLTSTARQDYDIARYSLTEFAPKFLAMHPKEAVVAIVAATEGFIAREHPISPNQQKFESHISGRTVRLQEDWSYVWAHSPDKTYGHDADALILELLKFLRSAEQSMARNVVEQIIADASFAIFWSRIFLAAAERNDGLVDLLLPIAMSEPFLMVSDTRKDAIDLVAVGYDRLSVDERIGFETAIGVFEFSRFDEPEAARAHFLHRVFSAIGRSRLATEAAKSTVVENKGADLSDQGNNRRLFTLTTTTGEPEPFHWIEDLDLDSSVDQVLMWAINDAKKALGLEASSEDATKLTMSKAIAALTGLETAIDRTRQNTGLVAYAEGVIGQGIAKIISLKITPSVNAQQESSRFLGLMSTALESLNPAVDDDTEANFERSASWGSPAARVEIASAVLDLTLQRPDLYPELASSIDGLISDPHPAVRLQSGLHLVRIWDLDRTGFWTRLESRLERETNLSILKSLINSVLGRLLHSDPDRITALAVSMNERFSEHPKRQAELDEALSSIYVVLWITHEKAAAYEIISSWINNRESRGEELTQILQTMRGALVLGLKEDSKNSDNQIRHRAIDLTSQIVRKSSEGLKAYVATEEPTLEQIEVVREDAKLLDTACMQIYFSVGASDSKTAQDQTISKNKLGLFFEEITPVLEQIGDHATPHTIYYLLQLLEYLLPVDPARSFDLIARALKGGGRQSGYQYESMGADLLVRLLGIFLADHKELFESDVRRAALIDCLEIFMDAGWPSARRLLYRLPELIQ